MPEVYGVIESELHRGSIMAVSIQRVLFVTDFSEPARKAQQYAVSLAETFGAQLYAFHAVSEEVFVPAPDTAVVLLHAEVERARTALATEVARTSTTKPVIQEVRQGNAVQEIIRYAAEQNIDLIVLATHGRTGLSRFLMGSVAEKVVRLATCPVLTVHPTGHQFTL